MLATCTLATRPSTRRAVARSPLRLAIAAWGLAALSTWATETAPPVKLTILGSWSMLSQYQDHEKPFWQDTVPRLSEGRISVDVKGFNEAGLKGSEVVRLMKLGLADFGTTVISYTSADDPVGEGVDLAGLATDPKTAQRVADAYLPVMSAAFEQKYGIRVMALWPYPAQMLFCKKPIANLDSLRGKKVRVSLRTTSDLIEALGAITVSIPFDETYASIKAGEVDCLITGTLPAYTARFHEVTTHLYNLPVGWSIVMLGVNLAAWEKLAPQDQAMLKTEIGKLSNTLWKTAEQQTSTGIACTTATRPCPLGEPGKLTLVASSEADRARMQKVVREVVAKRWAERCGASCAQAWSATAGKVVGMTAAP